MRNAENQDRCDIPRLRDPDLVEKPWTGLVSSQRSFLPLLGAPLAHPMGEGSGVREMESGERVGVRAGVSAHFESLNGPVQGAGSGVLRLLSWSRLSDNY